MLKGLILEQQLRADGSQLSVGGEAAGQERQPARRGRDHVGIHERKESSAGNCRSGVVGGGVAVVGRHDRQRDGQIVESMERSEEHTSELQSLMRISYAVFCLKKKT